MNRNFDLTGRTILLVEDNSYLAEDIRRAFEDEGGHVLGPCPSIVEAIALLRDGSPNCTVLDVSLSDDPSFDLARLIITRGIPVLFISG